MIGVEATAIPSHALRDLAPATAARAHVLCNVSVCNPRFDRNIFVYWNNVRFGTTRVSALILEYEGCPPTIHEGTE